MESINSFKGYGKVDPAENETFRRKTMRRTAIVVVSTVILVAVVVGTVVGTVVHKKNKDSKSPPPTANDVQAICNLTLNPDSCYSSLSLANTSDPKALLKYSLKAAIDGLSGARDLPSKLSKGVDGAIVSSSLSDCSLLIENALDTLNDTVLAVDGADANKLTAAKVDDLRTWLSSVITDRETCLDSLMEGNDTGIIEQIKSATQNSTALVSDALAIVSKVFGLLSTKNRKLLGHESGFPRWLRAEDRRILQDLANPKPDVTVAQDGSGDVKTIEEAVAKISKKSNARFIIYIKSGIYKERIDLPKSAWNVMIYGDGMGKTVITESKSVVVDKVTTFRTSTFSIAGKNFIAKGITFQNKAGPENHQAVAFRSGSDTSVYYECEFDAYQDTLYSHSNRQFYSKCKITGTIDFIFGNAAAVFQECQIRPRQPMAKQFNTITAQGKVDPNQNTGISIHKSTIVANGAVTVKTYLGRPWKEYSTTVVMRTEIGDVVDPTGWTPWVTGVDPPKTIFYGEYMNTGAGAALGPRVKWSSYYPTLTAAQAGKYTVGSFIDGKSWIPTTAVAFSDAL